MFKQSGPLGSFAAQIDMGYLLGLYPDYVRDKLHTIRLIRNEFAHNVQPVSFKSQRDSCSKLKPKREATRDVNANLRNIAKAVGAKTSFTTFKSSTNPRTQYIRAVQQITLLLNVAVEFGKHSQWRKETDCAPQPKPWPSPEKSQLHLPFGSASKNQKRKER